jgi:hypothetical protein
MAATPLAKSRRCMNSMSNASAVIDSMVVEVLLSGCTPTVGAGAEPRATRSFRQKNDSHGSKITVSIPKEWQSTTVQNESVALG